MGPTHEIRNQAVPGYTGFIPGVKAENVFSRTYANTSSSSFKNDIVRGHDPLPKDRFATIAADKFSPRSFRRIEQNPDFASRRDYLEYTLSVNKEMKSSTDKFLNSPERSNSVRQLTENKKPYKDPTGTTISPLKFKRDLQGSPLLGQIKEVQVKPLVLERSLANSLKYQKLSAGFQNAFTLEDAEDQGMKLPISGYTGHRKGLKAENVYAKNFRDCSINAEKKLRL